MRAAPKVSVLGVDSSITLAWILLELDFKERVNRAVERVADVGGVVPQLWHYEVRNSILVAERRGRISRADSDQRFQSWGRIPIETDLSPDLDAAMTLGRRHALKFYDAIYVELTVRVDGQLATLDQAMARAAEAEGVPIV